MVKDFIYPSKESIIFVNEIINIMSARKADKHELLASDTFIDDIIYRVKNAQGDVYDKAAVLLHSIIRSHGFASGNKRTGFIVTTHFLLQNHGRIRFRNFNKVEKVIRRLRALETEDIAAWLRTGDIDESKIE
ncbi:MAG: Fic family protein [Candidatus Aenigmarchaeota archaeon]|nr:Fic family protein [Candidatus Aenigmarchaeota archaeon]